MSSINIHSNNQELSSIDRAIKKLTDEAKLLFHVLDEASTSLRHLETQLGNLKANFPFRLKIDEEQCSHYKELEARHLDLESFGNAYFTQVYWYIAWEVDDESKKFRLLLISEEKEIVDRGNSPYEFSSKLLFKKPLIETDLATRLKYTAHLEPFIEAFTEFLSTYRRSIQGLPF